MIKIIIVAILNQCCTDNKVCVVITVAMTKRQNYLNAQFIFLYFALSFKKKKENQFLFVTGKNKDSFLYEHFTSESLNNRHHRSEIEIKGEQFTYCLHLIDHNHQYYHVVQSSFEF